MLATIVLGTMPGIGNLTMFSSLCAIAPLAIVGVSGLRLSVLRNLVELLQEKPMHVLIVSAGTILGLLYSLVVPCTLVQDLKDRL